MKPALALLPLALIAANSSAQSPATNGASIAKVAKRVAPANKLYLTTTHYHPEHASGDAGFPAGTILIRNRAQQNELDQHGMEMIQSFSSPNSQYKELLAEYL